jgi:hypothetical protein
MKNTLGITIVCTLLTLNIALCQSKAKAESSVIIKNNSSSNRTEVIVVDISNLEKKQRARLKVGIGAIGKIPVECLDTNKDGVVDKLSVLASLPAGKSVSLNLQSWMPDPSFQKKTQAEISIKKGGFWKGREYQNGQFENVDFVRVPKEHTDHSWYIRYEGPGWENEMIGYRFYLDWRNAADIFGKKVNTLVLQDVGQDGFDSYHEESDWGMDILKAGKSLGIGSIGRMNDQKVVEHFEKTDSVTCEITVNGALSSSIETNYYGWQTSLGKCDLNSQLTIHTGDRATTHRVTFDKEVSNFCTGIVKHPSGEYFTKSSEKWSYIATYGNQTLFDDKLGMAIFYKNDQAQRVATDDEHSYLVLFNPAKELEYQFLGAWEKEPNGITDRAAFEALLDQKLAALDKPFLVEIK